MLQIREIFAYAQLSTVSICLCKKLLQLTLREILLLVYVFHLILDVPEGKQYC